MSVSDKACMLLENRLNQLGDSTKINGEIWRALYTSEEDTGKRLIKEWMTEAGMDVYEDGIGNLFGKIEGTEEGTILVGSHMDTVKDGGKYDGAAGIVIGIAAVEELLKNHGRPSKTVEVVAMVEEEASRFPTGYLGSKTISGKMTDLEFNDEDSECNILVDVMKTRGYSKEGVVASKRQNIDAFIEVHVEQGPVLEHNGKKIGIVENIVGLIGYVVKIKGRQDHAGTTPMDLRMDPLVEAADLIVEITAAAKTISPSATFTVGSLNTKPGMANVIADEVEFTIDLRGIDRVGLIEIKNRIDERFKVIEESGFIVDAREICSELPVKLDRELADILEKSLAEKKMEYTRINSGAGHDAQIMADVFPTSLIFIPSKNGRSHCSNEFTHAPDLGQGTEALIGLLEEIAWN